MSSLVAKDAKVVYNKSFGYHTYDSLNTVDEFDVYDLASITKIFRYSYNYAKVDVEALILINQFKYLSIEDTCSSKLSSRNISTSRTIMARIPFYRETLMDDGNLNQYLFLSKKS